MYINNNKKLLCYSRLKLNSISNVNVKEFIVKLKYTVLTLKKEHS